MAKAKRITVGSEPLSEATLEAARVALTIKRDVVFEFSNSEHKVTTKEAIQMYTPGKVSRRIRQLKKAAKEDADSWRRTLELRESNLRYRLEEEERCAGLATSYKEKER